MENLNKIVCCISMLISTVSILFIAEIKYPTHLSRAYKLITKILPHRLLRITVNGTFATRILTAVATTSAAVILTVRGTFGGKRRKVQKEILK